MVPPPPLPDCPSCSAADTLRTVQHVRRDHLAECSCCARLCRITEAGAEPLPSRVDLSGLAMNAEDD